jgi:hypothetical protein
MVTLCSVFAILVVVGIVVLEVVLEVCQRVLAEKAITEALLYKTAKTTSSVVRISVMHTRSVQPRTATYHARKHKQSTITTNHSGGYYGNY